MAILNTKGISVGEMRGLSIAFPWIKGEVRPFIPQGTTTADFMIPLPEGCPRVTPLYPPALARFFRA